MYNFLILWRLLKPVNKLKFFLVLLLSLLATLSELLSVGALFPLLEIALGSENLDSGLIRSFDNILVGELNGIGFKGWIYIFILLLVSSYGLRFLYLWSQNRLSYGLGNHICERFFAGISKSTYEKVSGNNTDFYVTSVTVKLSALIEGLIVPIMSLLSSFLMLVLLAGAVVSTAGVFALLGIGLVGGIYALIMALFKTALQRLSKTINDGYEDMSQFAMAAKAGFREWKLLKAEAFLSKKFSIVCRNTLQAHALSRILSSSPRLIVEPFIIISGLVYIFFNGGEDALLEFLPIIGVAAFALQRFMPYIQAAFAGWTYIKSNEVSVTEILEQVPQEQLKKPKSSITNVKITDYAEGSIVLDSVSFNYAKGATVLHHFHLQVHPGEILGIAGPSGSGKSTIINLVLGFLSPSHGSVFPGGLSQSHLEVGYVSQDIFILDGTVEENIALGLNGNLVNHDWLREVIDIVELSSWLDSLELGTESLLRSDGNGVSGGERQRIGIARALYHKPKILILDEASSALDSETEKAILEKIFEHVKSRGITVLCVSHRKAPLDYCDRIVSLNNSMTNMK